MKTVTVLGGGPDAEREVSLVSSGCVADALGASTRYRVRREVIDRLDLATLRAVPGDVFFPVLHGPWGEGGPLQDLLQQDGRPFVGCRAPAARLAMDKIATKLAAAAAGVPTAPAGVLNLADEASPVGLPAVIKPVHEGSSVGVHICRDADQWAEALTAVRADRREHPHRAYMVEQAVLSARELTVSVLEGEALAPIEIKPAAAFYDYHAKYHSNDTRYECDPALPAGVRDAIRTFGVAVCRALGVRHLARVDFLLSPSGQPFLLEANTMPGFTGHSLFPMAANHAGISFSALTERLADAALRDHAH